MTLQTLELEGLLLIQPAQFADERGVFLESFRQEWFASLSPQLDFIQDNISRSEAGVVRGLHYQMGEHAQGKLITVCSGCILDVAVDIRKKSPTFGRWIAIELNEENGKELWIPPGFAHGFSVLSERAVVQYKCTAYYNKASERGIRWDDPDLAIDWKVQRPLLSPKDQVLPRLGEIPENELF